MERHHERCSVTFLRTDRNQPRQEEVRVHDVVGTAVRPAVAEGVRRKIIHVDEHRFRANRPRRTGQQMNDGRVRSKLDDRRRPKIVAPREYVHLMAGAASSRARFATATLRLPLWSPPALARGEACALMRAIFIV
jgi:hypothetical protein